MKKNKNTTSLLPIITKNLKRATNKKETKTEKKNKNTKMAKYVKRAKNIINTAFGLQLLVLCTCLGKLLVVKNLLNTIFHFIVHSGCGTCLRN